MSNVTEWLSDLGLGQYTELFAENAIDLRALPHLTDDDLSELEIPLGHRRILLAAVTDLGRRSATTGEAERRQLTILFSDLVGSTALSSRLDPEDMRDLIRAYQDACTAVVARYEGFVAKYMGDGILIYFGYPSAHEDDAERAVNTGLGIVEAIKELKTRRDDGLDLSVRIGIATGTVAVGDIVGEGASEEAAIVGEAPNLAARLQEIAEPNTVVIGESTQRLASGLFETVDLGKRDLKGFADPIGAWAVIRSHRVVSRFEATRGEHLTSRQDRGQSGGVDHAREWSGFFYLDRGQKRYNDPNPNGMGGRDHGPKSLLEGFR